MERIMAAHLSTDARGLQFTLLRLMDLEERRQHDFLSALDQAVHVGVHMSTGTATAGAGARSLVGSDGGEGVHACAAAAALLMIQHTQGERRTWSAAASTNLLDMSSFATVRRCRACDASIDW
jgi:hypothetical protein